jgi:hypothetical protein
VAHWDTVIGFKTKDLDEDREKDTRSLLLHEPLDGKGLHERARVTLDRALEIEVAMFSGSLIRLIGVPIPQNGEGRAAGFVSVVGQEFHQALPHGIETREPRSGGK